MSIIFKKEGAPNVESDGSGRHADTCWPQASSVTAVGTSSTDGPRHTSQAVQLAEGSVEPTMAQDMHVLGSQGRIGRGL